MPADARREPPSEARHGHGRPPDGPPDEGSWAFARGFRSLLGWSPSQAAPALPPLTASGLRAQQESSQQGEISTPILAAYYMRSKLRPIFQRDIVSAGSLTDLSPERSNYIDPKGI